MIRISLVRVRLSCNFSTSSAMLSIKLHGRSLDAMEALAAGLEGLRGSLVKKNFHLHFPLVSQTRFF